jgi:3',5'-cyclic AMP phosphodiesterase CpdA
MKKSIRIIILITVIVLLGGHIFYFLVIKSNEKDANKYLTEAKQMYDAIPVWHKKIQTTQDIKVGIITDTHVRPTRIDRSDERDDAPRELKEKDIEPLQRFVQTMSVFQPAFIVHGGDVIEGTGDDWYVGSKGVNLVREELEKSNVSVYWLVGNHDLRALTKDEYGDILGIPSLEYVFDQGDYRFIALDANFNYENEPRSPDGGAYIRGKLPQEKIEWLIEQLKTDKRVFVFMHHGAFADDSAGDEGKKKQSIINASELRAVFEEYRVDGFFNGHMEARRYEKSRYTHYYSLTGTEKSILYPQSYYALTITDGTPDVRMYYLPDETQEVREVDFESGEN